MMLELLRAVEVESGSFIASLLWSSDHESGTRLLAHFRIH
jgi:hypothetical protein